jgi:integrase
MPKLTKRSVESARPEPGRDVFLWDSALPGFGLRVKPSGARSYIAQYRTWSGRSKRMTLGRHGVLTVDEARSSARQVLASAARGDDPAGEKAEARRAITFSEFADRYLDQHATPKKKASSAATDRRNLRLHLRPALGSLTVAEITRADVVKLHHDMRETPGAANRILALLSKMMNLAERWGLRHDGSNPCRHVERYPERRRERFLSAAELGRLGDVLRELEAKGAESPSVIGAIRLLVLTGARRSEILNLRWEHVDLERALLRLPDSKTGAKVIHLGAPALQVLAGLPRRCEWVLPTASGSGPVSLSGPWNRIRQQADLEDVRIHDLRHSFASVGAGAGLGLPIIGKLLGHRAAATTARYAHLADDPVRQASEAISSRIAASMGDGRNAELVELQQCSVQKIRRSGRTRAAVKSPTSDLPEQHHRTADGASAVD